jgi:hypothetical protein
LPLVLVAAAEVLLVFAEAEPRLCRGRFQAFPKMQEKKQNFMKQKSMKMVKQVSSSYQSINNVQLYFDH